LSYLLHTGLNREHKVPKKSKKVPQKVHKKSKKSKTQNKSATIHMKSFFDTFDVKSTPMIFSKLAYLILSKDVIFLWW
jgi:hypothetical protein